MQVNPEVIPYEDFTIWNAEFHESIRKQDGFTSLKALIYEEDYKGILLCSHLSRPFEHYYINLIEVKQLERRKGIATALLKELDTSDFLKNQILQLGFLTHDGGYIQSTRSRILQAKSYVIIPNNYKPETPPTFSQGIVDKFGKKIRS